MYARPEDDLGEPVAFATDDHSGVVGALHCPDLARAVVEQGIAASVSDTTIWRWLSADAIKPWRHRSWIFPRDPDRPNFVPMRRDGRAIQERYNEQPVEVVLKDLGENAARFASVLDGLTDEQWHRTGVYHWPETADRSLEWVARQTLHEGLHHLEDVSAGVAALRQLRDRTELPPAPRLRQAPRRRPRSGSRW